MTVTSGEKGQDDEKLELELEELILKKMRTSAPGGGGVRLCGQGEGSKMAENLQTSFMDGP